MNRRKFARAFGAVAGLFAGASLSSVAAQTSGPLEYVASLTQSGEDAPVVVVRKNTLGGVVIWERLSAGMYRGVLAGAFPEARTTYRTSGFGLAEFDDPSVALNLYALGRSTNDACLLLQNCMVVDGANTTCALADWINQPILIEITIYQP